jgi:hypothetical protein
MNGRDRMKTGLLPVIALGVTSAFLRAIGQAPAADFLALGYLVTATVAFGRPALLTRSRTGS